MNEVFIEKIKINKVRHLQNFEIEVSENQRKHLIITGKNGSGKTSLLLSIKNCLEIERFIIDNKLESENIEISIHNIESIANYSIKTLHSQNFIIAFFGAKHGTELIKPIGIQKIELKELYSISEKANKDFIQYLVNLKAQRSFARDANKMEVVKNIDDWFAIFERFLKQVFEDENLLLEFDSENFNFNLVIQKREKFDLNTLSDGYSAIMNIVTELILRMEKTSSKNYNLQGIVLIDEPETHLHIEMQKQVIPLLSTFFPNVQFIVATHSPFIINSVKGAVVYDLETGVRTENLSKMPIENVSEYLKMTKTEVQQIENEIDEFVSLVKLVEAGKEITDAQGKRIAELDLKLNSVVPKISDDSFKKFKQSQKILY